MNKHLQKTVRSASACSVPAILLTEQIYVPRWEELEAEAMKRVFPSSRTPIGRGLPSDIDQVTVRGPLPRTSQMMLTGSPSVTKIGDGVVVAEGGSASVQGEIMKSMHAFSLLISKSSNWYMSQ